MAVANTDAGRVPREFFSYSAFTVIFAPLFPDFRHCSFGASRVCGPFGIWNWSTPYEEAAHGRLVRRCRCHAGFGQSFSLVKDTAGNCAAVVTSKSPYPGMKVVSEKTYTSWDEASKALDSIKVCTSFVR